MKVVTMDEMNKDHFEYIIKDKLTNYTVPVDADTWKEIEKRLAAYPKRRVWLPWISGAAVAASIALLWLIFPFNKHVINNETTMQLPDYEETITTGVFEEKVLLSDKFPSIQIEPVRGRQNSIAGTGNGKMPVLPQFDVIADEENLPVMAEMSAPKAQPADEADYKSPEHFVMVEIPAPEAQPADETEHKSPELFFLDGENLALNENENDSQQNPLELRKKQAHKSFALRAGSGAALLAMNDGLSLRDGSDFSLRASNSTQNTPSQNEFNPNDYSQNTHYPPLSFGLSVRKGLSSGLALESGLTYSYLYSKYENKISQRQASMELHYLGIPLYLVVSPFQDKHSRWQVYASGGFMVEKGLLLRYSQTWPGNITGMSIVTSSNEKIRGLQWSVDAAIGIDYKIVKNYSVYLEPQVSYYLNNNQPYNIRTVNPFVWGMNGGIRFTW
jgi:hypothetical protein